MKEFVVRVRFVLFVLLAIAIGGCGSSTGKKNKEKATSENKIITKIKHFNDDPHAPVEWKVKVRVDEKGKAIREGESIRYSKGGKVYERINYVDNKKHGKRFTYHTTGKVWKEQPYKNGKLDGLCKRFDRNGKLTAEYSYKQGLPGVGLKEYTNLGKIRKMPVLKVERKDEIRSLGRYKLVVSLTGENMSRIRSVEYFIGQLIEDKYLHGNLQKADVVSGKKGTFIFKVPKGQAVKKTVNVVVKGQTREGLLLILQKKVNISVVNP